MARSTSKRSPRPAPVSERGETTLDLVLSTSTQLFAERGYAAATMRELADRAKLPLSGFYYYFRSKYDVLLAIMDVAQGRLEQGITEVDGSGLDPAEHLRELVDRHVRAHLFDPAAARVADGELRALLPADRKTMVARRDRYERHFREVLTAGIATGCFSADLDVPIASIAILTMCTGVVDWWRPGGRHSIDETARLLGVCALGIAGCVSER